MPPAKAVHAKAEIKKIAAITEIILRNYNPLNLIRNET